MPLFSKKKPAVVQEMPSRKWNQEFIRQEWWAIFSAPFKYAELEDIRSIDIPKCIDKSRAIADAAIDEFEKRWAE